MQTSDGSDVSAGAAPGGAASPSCCTRKTAVIAGLCLAIIAAVAFGLNNRSKSRPGDVSGFEKIGAKIERDGQGRIVGIDLEGKLVSDDDLALLANVPDLERLSLARTPISDAGLVHLKPLAKLRELSLWESEATGAGFDHLSSLVNLESLDVHDQDVSSESLVLLKPLKKLRALDLNRCRGISDAGLEIIAGYPELRVLRLSGNRFSLQGLTKLTPLKHLAELDLSGLGLDDLSLAPLVEITSLESLDVQNNIGIARAGIARLAELPNLKRLSLRGTRGDDSCLKHIAAMSALEEVSLRGLQLTDAGLADLASSRSIKSLDVQNNRGITDAGLTHLAGWDQLEQLNIQGTSITDAGVPELLKLRGLKSIEAPGLVMTDVRDPNTGVTDTLNRPGGMTVIGLAYLLDKGLTVSGDAQVQANLKSGLTKFSTLPPLGQPFGDEALALLANPDEITELTLAFTEVTDDGLAALEKFPKLDSLILSSRNTDASLSHVAKLGGLRRLSIYFAEGITAAGLANLAGSKIEQLGYRPQMVSGGGLAHFAHLKSLANLQIVDPAFNDDDLSALGQMPSLKEISFANSNVSAAGWSPLSRLPHLRALSIQANIQPIGDAFTVFAALPELEELDLTKSLVADAPLASLAKCKSLKGLSLTETGVTDAGLKHVAECAGLEQLFVGFSYRGITDAGLKELTRIGGLKTLYINNNDITDAGVPALHRFAKLENLDLSVTKVGDDGLRELHSMTQLRQLVVSDLRVSTQAVVLLQRALPNCEVIGLME